jgi:hypothetical protein
MTRMPRMPRVTTKQIFQKFFSKKFYVFFFDQVPDVVITLGHVTMPRVPHATPSPVVMITLGHVTMPRVPHATPSPVVMGT